MTTISLIIPPSAFLLDERVFMSLGILKVAAVLEEAGHAVELLDLSGVENCEEVVGLHAATSKANIFGITTTTPQLPAVMNMCASVREHRTDAKIILGGPHVTLANAACKREKKLGIDGRATRAFQQLSETFDVLVAGDGEGAIFDAIDGEAPKLVDADEPRSALFLTDSRLNEMPFPARHLVDVDSYRYTIDEERALSLIAQLGCPFACGFCGGRESPSLRRVRTRATENIVAEIEHVHTTYGVRGFMFYDDELNVSPNMVELMESIRRLQNQVGSEFRLRGFLKSELFNDRQAESMYRAGFRWVLVGFESGAPRILENINKKATLEDNTRCVEICRKHGLKVKALMSIGHPGETKDTVIQTHDWLLEAQPDDFDVTIITTYPGTPYYDHAVRHPTEEDVWVYTYQKTGDRLYSYDVDYTEVADYYKGDPDGGYKSYVYTDYLSPDDLVELRDFVERDVRKKLHIPFNPSSASIRYEHSMGQFGGRLPHNILRTSLDTKEQLKSQKSLRVSSST